VVAGDRGVVLAITFVNDGTGTNEVANYTVRVAVNGEPLYEGRIEKHHRSDGWQELVRRFSTDVNRTKYNGYGFRVFSAKWRRKLSESAMGNQYGAKSYPAFINKDTGEIIPAGVNLTRLCRERELVRSCMRDVVRGEQKQHRGWMLYRGGKQWV
jgi:hypothetical protein